MDSTGYGMGSTYGQQRRRKTSNIPRYPGYYNVLLIAELVLGLVVFCVGIYVADILGSAGAGVAILSAFCSMVVAGWLLFALLRAPRLYHHRASLVLVVILTILWLLTTILFAQKTANVFNGSSVSIISGGLICTSGGCDDDNGSNTASPAKRSALAACTALSGLQFIGHLASLIVDCIAVRRHRRDGRNARDGDVAVASSTAYYPMYEQGGYKQQQEQQQQLQQQQFLLQPQQQQPQPQPFREYESVPQQPAAVAFDTPDYYYHEMPSYGQQPPIHQVPSPLHSAPGSPPPRPLTSTELP